MRPTSNGSSRSEIWRWNSPMPYIFGSIALVLGLITVALIILACSNRKRASNSASDHAEEKPPVKTMNAEADMEPKIVVIMAGDYNPTFIAKPISASSHSINDENV